MRSGPAGSILSNVQLITEELSKKDSVSIIFVVIAVSVIVINHKCLVKIFSADPTLKSNLHWGVVCVIYIIIKNESARISCQQQNKTLPITFTVKLQVALFPAWSTAEYVIRWLPWMNLWGGWWFDVKVGTTPVLSVARGSVQLTTDENFPRSAYAIKGLAIQEEPNEGEVTSAI